MAIIGLSLSGLAPGYDRIDVYADGEASDRQGLAEHAVSLDLGLYRMPSAGVELFRVKRFSNAGSVLTWIGIYRFAYQKGRGRPGYLSAGIWLKDSWLNGRRAVAVLKQIAEGLERACMHDDEFHTSVSSRKALFEGELSPVIADLQRHAHEILHHQAIRQNDYPQQLFDISPNKDVALFVGLFQVLPYYASHPDVCMTLSKAIVDAVETAGRLRIVNTDEIVSEIAPKSGSPRPSVDERAGRPADDSASQVPVSLTRYAGADEDVDTKLELQFLNDKVRQFESANSRLEAFATKKDLRRNVWLMLGISVIVSLVAPFLAELWKVAIQPLL